MRVLIVTGSFPPMLCGVGDYSESLAQELVKNHDINVAILTSLVAKRRIIKNNINIFEVMKKWEIINVFTAIKAIKSWNPDIVHIQYPTQGYGRGWLPYLLPMISFLMRKKVVQTWHEVYTRRDIPELFFVIFYVCIETCIEKLN
jgi:glycosyltransferase involved in cell wall biosynthesis